jgi:Fe-S-cluster containining protein
MENEDPVAARIPLAVIHSSAAPPAVTRCDGCGVCCREQNIPPYLDEIDFIPPALQREVLEARKHEAELAGKPCIWWDEGTRKCRHHEDRPNICREYEVGGELCMETRARFGVGG